MHPAERLHTLIVQKRGKKGVTTNPHVKRKGYVSEVNGTRYGILTWWAHLRR